MQSELTNDLQLRPLAVADWDASLALIVDAMRENPLNIHSLMAHHPAMLTAWWNYRNYAVQGGDLGRRNAELVILRVAVHMKSWYEWASHVERSLACGMNLEEIERVKEGASAQGWSDSDAVLLSAVDDLIANHRLSPGILADLAKHYSPTQVMDIVAIHGMYVTLGCMINTWGLELDAHVQEKLPQGVTREAFEVASGR